MTPPLPLRLIGAVCDGADHPGLAFQDHDDGGLCYAIAADMSCSWTGTPDEFNRRFRLLKYEDQNENTQ